MAGNGVLVTDFNVLNSVLANLQEKLSSAGEDYIGLVSDVEMINSSWSGEAHDIFMDTLNVDVAEVKKIIDELQCYVDDFKFAVKEYMTTEEEVGNMVSSLNF
ncbi:MAG: hypothetical protein LUH57_05675 [Ruminococcus sp.]|nr:hypothetical protein [Ruminococcus sp.]